jgi:hypothetical protein
MLLRESMGISADDTQRAFASRDIEAFLERPRIKLEKNLHVGFVHDKKCFFTAVDPSGGGASAFAVFSLMQLGNGQINVRANFPIARPATSETI